MFIAELIQTVKYATAMFLLSFAIFTGILPLVDFLDQALQVRLSHSIWVDMRKSKLLV